jgi:predicted methyltransferase
MDREFEELLCDLLRYIRRYRNPALAKRLLGLKEPMWTMLVEEAASRRLIHITQEQIRLLQSKSDADAFYCQNCQGTGMDTSAIEERAAEYRALGKHPQTSIDQCPVSAPDLARRAAFIYEKGDIRGKRILCIGDNDLTSLMIAHLGQPREIWVLDIDGLVLRTIAETAKKQALPIKTLRYDVRALETKTLPSPKELMGELKFDTFIIDPPYTDKGFRFFAALGVHYLKRRGVGYAIMPYMRLELWSYDLLFRVLSFFLSLNFVISDVRSSFQTYEHEASVISSLIRAERLGFVKDPFAELEKVRGKFYTAD